MKETMTIHKALTEIKILANRIQDEINSSTFVVANKHSNTKIGGLAIADFTAETKEKYQSIRTLINRRNAIKQAVTKSNAEVSVSIGGKNYTVAEAIDMKTVGLKYLKSLIDTLQRQYSAAKELANRSNGEKLEQRSDDYVKSMYSGVDMKNMADEIKKVREDFITAQTMELVDPIDAAKEITQLKNQYDAFMAEVDSALSVSNALTTIEIEYETK